MADLNVVLGRDFLMVQWENQCVLSVRRPSTDVD